MTRLKRVSFFIGAAMLLSACSDSPATPTPQAVAEFDAPGVNQGADYSTPWALDILTRVATDAATGPSLAPAKTKGWSALASVPTQPFSSGAEGMNVAAVGNLIIAVAGYDAGDRATTRIYDIASDTWSFGTDAPGTNSEGTAVSHGGLFYAIGGRGPGFNALWAYDPGTDSWTVLPPMPTGRAGLAAAVVGNAIYAIGGRRATGGPCTGNGVLEVATVERYDIDTGTWSTMASMPSARSGHAAVVNGGKIYVFGGCQGTANILADVDVYDPVTDTWSTAPTDMPTPRAGMYAAAAKGNKAYIIGGWDGVGSGLGTNEAYNFATDSWTTGLPSMPTPRAEAGAVGHGGRIYIVGGATPCCGASVANMDVYKPN